MFRLMASEADTHPETVKSFHESGPQTTVRNIAAIVSRYLPDGSDSEVTALKATNEYLALVRGEYFLELLLGTRTAIDDEEMSAHLDHCIEQMHRLYGFL